MKNQNWFAIWIDLIIVIVGVFIGMEIANWYQDQSDRVGAQRLITRLEEDFEDRKAELNRLSEIHYEATVAVDSLLTTLESGDALSKDAALTKLQSGLYIESPPSLPISFLEMVSSGRLDLLDETRLRATLRRVQALVTAYESVPFSVNFTDIHTAIRPHYRLTRQPSQQPSAESLEQFDVEGLWADKQAKNALYELYDMQRLAQIWIQADLKLSQRVLEEITVSRSK
ncbi:hypothetical protein R0137_12705 [Congregibacter brevis]|uniref:Uncharacterized protein n=1 Tax=Congregibacter brevis TaxID=3081201 RepID=A0ABZ0I9A6_9GAMM|nr:hypothetical protein R0137_12705 [Congregibacter sp. IMCC45268]